MYKQAIKTMWFRYMRDWVGNGPVGNHQDMVVWVGRIGLQMVQQINKGLVVWVGGIGL